MDIEIKKRWSVYSPNKTENQQNQLTNPRNNSIKHQTNEDYNDVPNFTKIFQQNPTNNQQENKSRYTEESNPARNTNPFLQEDNSRYPEKYNNPEVYADYDEDVIRQSRHLNGNEFGEGDSSRYVASDDQHDNRQHRELNPNEYEDSSRHLNGDYIGYRGSNTNQFVLGDNLRYRGNDDFERTVGEDYFEDSTDLEELDLKKTMDKIRQRAIPISEKIREFKVLMSSMSNLSRSKEIIRRNPSVWTKFKNKVNGIEMWKSSLKEIEYNLGSGIKGYFVFITWLLKLNIFTFLLMFLLVILPMILNGRESTFCDPKTNISTDCCTEQYFNASYENNHIFDFIQGTGFMEKTLLFQGFYSNKMFEYTISNKPVSYNLPLAYILVNFFIFFIYFVLNVHNASKIFQGNTNIQYLRYCNLVFNNWSFEINTTKLALKKYKEIEKEIRIIFDFELKEILRIRTVRDNKKKFIALRVVANLIVIAILIASAVGIFYAFNFSNDKLGVIEVTRSLPSINSYLNMFYEFLPSLSITLLNIVIPIIFSIIINLENYSQNFAVRLSLFRMIFLRMFSLCILYASLYAQVSCEVKKGECSSDCGLTCWETFVGQQFYKLVIIEFGVLLIMTFIVNFLRSRVGKLDNKFAKMIGEQTFDLPKHVLDVVYFQTVCWFGSYYVPFLSGMFIIIFFLMFYIKKFTCLVNCKPSSNYIPQSKAMFMIILLVSFLFAFVPLALSIAELTPSLSCGPFRGKTYVWNFVTDAVVDLPNWLQNLLDFLTAIPFHTIAFVILCLIIYYYLSILSTNNSVIRTLKSQIKQSQESNKQLIQRNYKHLIKK